MSTLKIVLFVATFTLFSCNKENNTPRIPSNPGTPIRSIVIDGRFLLLESSQGTTLNRNNRETDIHMAGEGSLNEDGAASLTMDHHEIFEMQNNKLSINEGDFQLWDQNGNEVFGEYNGLSNRSKDNLILNAVVTGGTGKFLNVYGNVTIQLTLQNNSEYIVRISGVVRIRRQDPQPVV